MGGNDGPISLPQGGGALSGLGEKFSPELFTGTGNFSVPLAVPAGRNGFQPDLTLRYSTGQGNGWFGVGWSIGIPAVTRKTSHGVPRYNERTADIADLDVGERQDVFLVAGSEDLVPIEGAYPGGRRYRPRTEQDFARIIHVATSTENRWTVATKDGLVHTYGVSGDAQTRDPATSDHIFAWHLTETRDPFGNMIRYEYAQDTGVDGPHRWDQPMLRRIRYVDFGDPGDPSFLVDLDLDYEPRPDSFSDHRAGFEIRTTQRCRAVRVSTRDHASAARPVREYRFAYRQDPNNGVSLLDSIAVIGYEDDGRAVQELPPLTFGYTELDLARRRFHPVTGPELPAAGLADATIELVDLRGCGLPDLVQLNGTARYWRNLGAGGFDLPRRLVDPPPYALGDPGVRIADADGDGRADLLVTQPPIAGYYSLADRPGDDVRWLRSFEEAPSVLVDDPEVRLVDLDGDGLCDILRTAHRFEQWFNDRDRDVAWRRKLAVERRSAADFPDVNLSDPRVRLADMTGDGLTDIVLLHEGNVEYWPSLGHGRWGARTAMRRSPRFPHAYDPRRILVGDIDGDGAADIVYVGDGEVLIWFNQTGSAWSPEPLVVPGTPLAVDGDDLRIVDLNGSGVGGVLWTTPASLTAGARMLYLDPSGGAKPCLLSTIDNHMGAVTRVSYRSSTVDYHNDERAGRRWRTTLPFPVQVVARVETVDRISNGKRTIEYRYHHGYWDGAEREFRGFGMVEQADSEDFETYHDRPADGGPAHLRFEEPDRRHHFAPPTLTRTWFHQGPIGDEFGDWDEADFAGEYWPGDPHLLDHAGGVATFLARLAGPEGHASGSERRAKRDALRSLRGRVLRTEVYALDRGDRESRPCTVTEHSHGIREVDEPTAHEPHRRRVFFPHPVATRTTRWDRGDDPATRFEFVDGFDDLGRSHRHTTVAMPRLAAARRAAGGVPPPDETRVLATQTRTSYAAPTGSAYIHDRVAHETTVALADPPGGPDDPADGAMAALRKQRAHAQIVRDLLSTSTGTAIELIRHTAHHYDGPAYEGMPAEHVGPYGARVRTEVLAFTDALLDSAFADDAGSRRPAALGGTAALPSNAPPATANLGYRPPPATDTDLGGWYVDVYRAAFDFQSGADRPRGLLAGSLDALGNESRFSHDEYALFTVAVTDAAGLATTADYDYRVLQPRMVTDRNGSRIHIRFSAMGLPAARFATGLDAGNETLGGTEDEPDLRFTYDYRNFDERGQPIYADTIRRVHHARDSDVGSDSDVIKSRAYSDGFGRLVQIRAQAEDVAHGDAGDEVGLPIDHATGVTDAVARRVADRVVVSGWQVYDNKGRLIEQYEPFFARGFDFQPESDAMREQHRTMHYGPTGRLVRVVHPDGSQQRIVHGRPRDPTALRLSHADLTGADVPSTFEPTPWEAYTYDRNDLAPLCTDRSGASLAGSAPAGHHFTPASAVTDALGRTVAEVQRNGPDPAADWFVTSSEYDLRGNLIASRDAHGRPAFAYAYDLLDRRLRVENIDGGLRTTVPDALGAPVESRDSRANLVLRTYDSLRRLRELWARERSSGQLTCRQRIEYGDDGDHTQARRRHTLGRATRHYDEAGLVEIVAYDFKGNILERRRTVLRDDVIAGGAPVAWDRSGAPAALEAEPYTTSSRYDALNRVIELTLPRAIDGERKRITPRYNQAGALESIDVAGDAFIEHIAYNARGQRVLVAYGNDVMTRYAYDPSTFRLARLRSEPYALDTTGGTEVRKGRGAPLQDVAYGYDLAGNTISADERTSGCGIRGTRDGPDRLRRTYAYDAAYRLIEATGRACRATRSPRGLDDDPRCGFMPSTTPDNVSEVTEAYVERYAYDQVGNILALSYQAPSGRWTRRFTTEGPGNRLTSVRAGTGVHTFSYDESGNRSTRDTERTYTWDHADRMVGYRVQPGTLGTPSVDARYLYGADGLRVKKWIRKQGRLDVTVYVDGVFEHHRQHNGSQLRENSLIHVVDQQQRLAIIRAGGAIDDRDGSPPVQYHLADHLGSSAVVVGGADHRASTFVNREEYFPYGETSVGSYGRKRYRHGGKERDEESGLYHYGLRYYDSGTARWTGADPFGAVDGLNSYRAFRNNPMSLIDTTGGASSDPPARDGDNLDPEREIDSEAAREVERLTEPQEAAWRREINEIPAELESLEKQRAAAQAGVFESGQTIAERKALSAHVDALGAHIVALQQRLEQLKAALKRASDLSYPGHAPDDVKAGKEWVKEFEERTRGPTPAETAAEIAQAEAEVGLTAEDVAALRATAEATTKTGWRPALRAAVARAAKWFGRGAGPATAAFQDTPVTAEGQYTADVMTGPGELLDPHLADAVFSGAQVEEAGPGFHITLGAMIGFAIGGPAGAAIGGLATADLVMYTAYRGSCPAMYCSN